MKPIHLSLIVLFFLSACAPMAQPAESGSSHQEPPATLAPVQPTQTAAPTATLTPTPTASPTPIGGSIPKIAHFFLDANAQKPEEQGVYLALPGGHANPEKLLSMPEVGLWYPLLKFSPDGNWLLVAPNHPNDEPASQTKSLDLIDIFNGEVRTLSPINPNVHVEQIDWSPNGQWVMVMYYTFGNNINQIDVYSVVSGEKISVGKGDFIGWLPDSTGVITQLNASIDLFPLETRQKKPYLPISTLSRRSGMTPLALLPEHDALLMLSGDNLVIINGLSTLFTTGGWDFDAVPKNTIMLGKIPAGFSYWASSILFSPQKDRFLVTGATFERKYFAHIYTMDGLMEVLEYSDILAVAWSPDGLAFLGIEFNQVPYKGTFSVSNDPYEANYVIQPIDNSIKPVVIYNLPPTCGLLSESSFDGGTFNQHRFMASCITLKNTQDAIWK